MSPWSADSELIGAPRLGRPFDRVAGLERGAHEQEPERLRQDLGEAASTDRESALLQHRSEVKAVAGARQRDINEPFGFLPLSEAVLVVAVRNERADRDLLTGD